MTHLRTWFDTQSTRLASVCPPSLFPFHGCCQLRSDTANQSERSKPQRRFNQFSLHLILPQNPIYNCCHMLNSAAFKEYLHTLFSVSGHNSAAARERTRQSVCFHRPLPQSASSLSPVAHYLTCRIHTGTLSHTLGVDLSRVLFA